MDRRLIINADDFGLCESVNSAVEKAHRDGVLSSATIMANMPAADGAVEIAKKLDSLGVGVHLNLTEGEPISRTECVRSLTNSEAKFGFSPNVLAILSTAVHRIRNAIRAELSAQIQWVLDRGIEPTHLDSHKHIHCFASIYPIVCELARKFGIKAVRYGFEPKAISSVPWPLTDKRSRKKSGLLRQMAKINRLQQPYFLKTDCLLGLTHTGKIDVSFFKAVSLYNKAATAEVMTHPGTEQQAHSDRKKTELSRKTELAALCDERTKRYFKESHIKLIHYGQL